MVVFHLEVLFPSERLRVRHKPTADEPKRLSGRRGFCLLMPDVFPTNTCRPGASRAVLWHRWREDTPTCAREQMAGERL